MAEFDPTEYIPELINNEYYIKPGTDVFILRGVPLDNTYEHTIVWENLNADRTQQRDYFLSKAKFGIPKNSYQRVDRFWLKVNVNAEYLMDCNYIMFKNTPFNMVKWYYAFITDVEYINNNTSKIRYQLDVMQTWLPGQNRDYQLLPCFIERCHAKSDELYENLIAEDIVTNESDKYVIDAVEEFDMNELAVCILATEVYLGANIGQDFTPASSVIEYGQYGKVSPHFRSITKADGSIDWEAVNNINDYLNAYITGGKENSIIAIYMFPKKFLNHGDTAPTFSVQLPKPMPGQTLGGNKSTYVPKNNKLYSFPYNVIRVNNQCGTTKLYKWEYFDDSSRGKFTVSGAEIWMPCAVIYPNKYKGIAKNMEDSVTFDGFTVSPWASDAYHAWWAQNAAQVGVTVFGGVASIAAAIAGGASGNPMLLATGIGGAVSSTTKIITSLHQANHTPTAEHGPTNTSLVLPALKNIKFVVTKESLRADLIRIYDDYFTKYGYAQKSISIPSLVNREHWTYVQTTGFEFNGEINDTDTKKIKSIFDNGITFWRNPNEIGHYELSNDPLL